MTEKQIEKLRNALDLGLIVWIYVNDWHLVRDIGPHSEEDLPVAYIGNYNHCALDNVDIADVMVTSPALTQWHL